MRITEPRTRRGALAALSTLGETYIREAYFPSGGIGPSADEWVDRQKSNGSNLHKFDPRSAGGLQVGGLGMARRIPHGGRPRASLCKFRQLRHIRSAA